MPIDLIMNKMEFPKKINIINLVETVIELRFVPNPELNRDLWAGMLAKQLSDLGYQYHNVPQINIIPENNGVLKFSIDNKLINTAINLFINDEKGLRIVIDHSNISFNCLRGKYLGWEEYYDNIIKVLDIIHSSGIIGLFDRTMIRYINEYSYNILDYIDIDVKLPSSKDYETREISLSHRKDNFITFISISGLRDRVSKATREKRMTSLFDINVYENLNKESNLSDVYKSLSEIHRIETETFFSMLKKDYLKSLNPIY